LICNGNDDGIVGTLGAKRILSRDYQKIKTIQLPHYKDKDEDDYFNSLIEIYERNS
jgi:hypothetical protein